MGAGIELVQEGMVANYGQELWGKEAGEGATCGELDRGVRARIHRSWWAIDGGGGSS